MSPRMAESLRRAQDSVVRPFFLAVLLLVAACQTRGGFEQQLASWKGRPIKEWVAEHGGPNWIKDGPAGEKLYTWQFGEARNMRVEGPGGRGGGLQGSPSMSALSSDKRYSVCTVTLIVDQELIKDSSFEGDACVAAAP